MQLLLTFIFLAFAFATGVHAYVLKNTLSHWAVSILSAIASLATAWTALYSGARFFYDPAKIMIDTLVFKLNLVFTNHAPTETLVLGNFWLLACAAPLVLSVLLARELRKLPAMQEVQPTDDSQQDTAEHNEDTVAEELAQEDPVLHQSSVDEPLKV